MPCYDPPMTNRELRELHERYAESILRDLHIRFTSGPNAVRVLCEWCNKSTIPIIKAAHAQYWYEDHKKFDLQRSGLAKLTAAEKKALGLKDEDEAGRIGK